MSTFSVFLPLGKLNMETLEGCQTARQLKSRLDYLLNLQN